MGRVPWKRARMGRRRLACPASYPNREEMTTLMAIGVTRMVFPLDFGVYLCESDGVPFYRPRLAPLLLLFALSVALGVLAPGRADAADVTYEVVESWSV